MTPIQKKVFVALAAIIAMTRLLAIAKSLFDWDEGLFAGGIREYDVVNHHPHPPGYPLFIAAAKVLHATGIEEYRSLQTIVVFAAMLLFPALYLLTREVGFGFTTSAGGAALFCFLPNVWIYGGTGFSDIPAMTTVVCACWLLLRGRRNGRAYLAGAIVLGIAAGIRPPSLVLGAVPAVLATYHRLRARDIRSVIAAFVAGAVIVTASYLGAAIATGTVSSYVKAVKTQSDYVRDIDSWRNPGREPLHEVAEDFFLRPVRQQLQMYGLVLLLLISLTAAIVKRRAAPLLVVALFLPFAVLAWFTLDVQAAGRYSIPYMAAYAILAVDGVGVLVRHRIRLQTVIVTLIVVVFVVWTWPALSLQRTSDPPPVAALKWVKQHVPPGEPVYIHAGVGPLADHIVPERTTFWERPEQVSTLSQAWVVDLKPQRDARNFIWPRSNPMWKIVRRRNFEASVMRVSSFITLGPEWYSEEGTGLSAFRWIPGTATASLPPLKGTGKLYVRFHVPVDALPSPPVVEVTINGDIIERITATEPSLERSWIVAARADRPNDLRITTSAVVNPARMGQSSDTRDLGLRVDALSWTAAN